MNHLGLATSTLRYEQLLKWCRILGTGCVHEGDKASEIVADHPLHAGIPFEGGQLPAEYRVNKKKELIYVSLLHSS